MPFPPQIRIQLSHETGGFCSRPSCRTFTGVVDSQRRVPNGGDAAHIKAEKSDQPRYDPSQSDEERNSAENGVWLCPTCHRRVDRYAELFTTEELHDWKREAVQHNLRLRTGHLISQAVVNHGEEIQRASLFSEKIKEIIQELFSAKYHTDSWSNYYLSDEARLEIVHQCRKGYTNPFNNRSPEWCFSDEANSRQQELIQLFRLLDSLLPPYPSGDPFIINFRTHIDQNGNHHYHDKSASAIGLLIETYQEYLRFIERI